MNCATQIFALLAGLLHILIFFMESVWFMNPKVHKRFGAKTKEEAEINKLFAFNQGFYNLFLAMGVLGGLAVLHFGGNPIIGYTLVLFNCLSMLAAAGILVMSAGKRMLRAAFIQGIFPLLCILFWFLS